MIESRYLSIKSYCKRIYLLCAFAAVSSFVLPLNLNAQTHFPVPPALKSNIEFWTKIYSQYSTNHVVIHDNTDLSIIYDVVNLDDYFAQNVPLKTKWKKVEDVKDEYRDVLRRLSLLQNPIPLDSLSAEERHVYILWAQHDNPDKFHQARFAVRGQLGLRDRFQESVMRSGAIFDHIVATMEKYDLPVDLAYLPHVESLFDYNSHSKAGAVGLWQFISHTGRLFLTINSAIDERRDPFAATEAAAKLLKLNMDELNAWPLAITAYNHGLAGMKNAVQKTGTTDFSVIVENYQSRTFGFASRNFYAEFLAARQVAKNYTTYFGNVELEAPILVQSVAMPQNIYLHQLADIFDVPQETLAAYNPALRWNVTINQRTIPKGYELRLPHREGYDPREVFVQSTKPALRPRSAPDPDTILLAFHNATRDTLNSSTEADVLNLLKKPLPSLVEPNQGSKDNSSTSGI